METTEQMAKDLALETANTAVNLASTAAKTAADLAAKTAETTTEIKTNMTWMMKSLSSIEQTLSAMSKAFVTASQHQEVIKRQDEQEIRIVSLETEKTRMTVLVGGLIAIETSLAALVSYHMFH